RGLSREQQGKPPLELGERPLIVEVKASQVKPHGNIESPKWAIEPQYRHFFSWVFLNNFYTKLTTSDSQKNKVQRDLIDIKAYFYGWATMAAKSSVRNRLMRLRVRSVLILGSGYLYIPPSALELIPPSKLKVPLAEIDFTTEYCDALPDEIWDLMDEMSYESSILTRADDEPWLTGAQVEHIRKLPPLSDDVAKEVRLTLTK